MIDYKAHQDIICIYRLYHKDLSYIGCTRQLRDRLRRHNYSLSKNEHHNKQLQAYFNKYENVFSVEILKTFKTEDKEILLEWETHYHDVFDSIEKGFNSDSPRRIVDRHALNEIQIEKRASKSRKRVVAINKETGEKYKLFESITLAAKHVKTSTSNISRACIGHFRYIKGYVFVYENDYDVTKNYKTAHHMKGVRKSPEQREKQRISSHRAKKTYAYEGDVLVGVYLSRSEAEKKNRLNKEYLRHRMETPLNGVVYTHNKK